MSESLYYAMGDCLPNAFMAVNSVKTMITKMNSKHYGWSLSYIASRLLATDPRDYIHGLLALTRLPIQPDYERSLGQTYQEYVSTWLKCESNLKKLEDIQELFFLKWAGRGFYQDREDLPSWAPRYDSKSVEYFTPISPPHNAGFGPDRGAFISDRLLCVNGIRVAPVVVLSGPLTDPPGLMTAVRTFVNRHPAHTPSGIPRLQAIYRMITGDTCYDSNESVEDQIRQAFVFVVLTRTALKAEAGTRASHLLSLGLGGDFEGDDSGTARFREIFTETFFPNDDIDSHVLDGCRGGKWETPYVLQLMNRLFNNVFRLWKFAEIAGQLGSHLALVPRYAAVKDIVCILRGTGWPVLLRREADEWVFVGRCFVLGVMNGEALGLLKSGRAEMEQFRIK
jgi:hypothetical protein